MCSNLNYYIILGVKCQEKKEFFIKNVTFNTSALCKFDFSVDYYKKIFVPAISKIKQMFSIEF